MYLLSIVSLRFIACICIWIALKFYNTTQDQYSLWAYCVFIQKFECIQLVSSNKKLDDKLQLFHGGDTYYTETSPFICRTNLWTAFYIIETSVMKELN